MYKKAKTFFEKYFDMTCFVNAGKQFVAMHDENHFVFNLIYGDDFKYPKELHIGFPQKVLKMSMRCMNDLRKMVMLLKNQPIRIMLIHFTLCLQQNLQLRYIMMLIKRRS